MWRRNLRTLTAGLAACLALAGCAGASEPEPDASSAPTASPPVSGTTSPAPDPTPPESTRPTTDEPVPEVEQDPELAAALAELIVEDLPPVSLLLSDDIAADCGVEAGGCWVPEDSTIHVTTEWTDFRRTELLAHEYLHHVWDRDALGSDTDLAAALDNAHADEELLGALVPPWQKAYVEDDGSIQPTELFSYACTGLRADQLGPLAERCGQYLRLDQLPVAQDVSPEALLDGVDALRASEGLDPLERNPHAAAASEARADLFTPASQVPLDEYPESVTTHLDAGCAPASYGARLTRPSGVEQMVTDVDELLEGALTSSQTRGVGVATRQFDHIDARELFGERTLRVNATLVVVTVCR